MRMFKVNPLVWNEAGDTAEAGNDLYISESCIQAINICYVDEAEILVTWKNDHNIVISKKRALEIIQILEAK